MPATAGSFWALRRKLIGPHLADWLNRLEADHDNLRAALDWLAHSAELEAFLRLARSLSLFWLFGPYEGGGPGWNEHWRWTANPRLCCDAMHCSGSVCWL